jgi:hypothetical protein
MLHIITWYEGMTSRYAGGLEAAAAEAATPMSPALDAFVVPADQLEDSQLCHACSLIVVPTAHNGVRCPHEFQCQG